jgi:inner membrane protein
MGTPTNRHGRLLLAPPPLSARMRLGRPAVMAAAVTVILLVDRSIWRPSCPWAVKGVGDETAHLATTALLLAPFAARVDTPVVLAALVGSVALDVDHVPVYARLLSDDRRPGTHSIATPAVVAAIGCLPGLRREQRRVVWGLCAGLASHLLRDVLTGGAPLLWPWSSRILGLHVVRQRPRGPI